MCMRFTTTECLNITCEELPHRVLAGPRHLHLLHHGEPRPVPLEGHLADVCSCARLLPAELVTREGWGGIL